MKQIMISTVKAMEGAALRAGIFFRDEARRFATEKRGDVNLASMVALTVVVVGAIVLVGGVLETVAPDLVTGLFEKIKELIGLS